MNDEEFERFRIMRRRLMGWQDGVEILLAVLAFAWALEMIFLPFGVPNDPISQSLLNWQPSVPVPLHGWLLATTCIVHAAAAWGKDPDMRCCCCFAETCFFFYAWYSVILHHLYLPLLFCGPVLIFFSAVNFWTLVRIAPAEVPADVEGMVVDGPLR